MNISIQTNQQSQNISLHTPKPRDNSSKVNGMNLTVPEQLTDNMHATAAQMEGLPKQSVHPTHQDKQDNRAYFDHQQKTTTQQKQPTGQLKGILKNKVAAPKPAPITLKQAISELTENGYLNIKTGEDLVNGLNTGIYELDKNDVESFDNLMRRVFESADEKAIDTILTVEHGKEMFFAHMQKNTKYFSAHIMTGAASYHDHYIPAKLSMAEKLANVYVENDQFNLLGKLYETHTAQFEQLKGNEKLLNYLSKKMGSNNLTSNITINNAIIMLNSLLVNTSNNTEKLEMLNDKFMDILGKENPNHVLEAFNNVVEQCCVQDAHEVISVLASKQPKFTVEALLATFQTHYDPVSPYLNSIAKTANEQFSSASFVHLLRNKSVETQQTILKSFVNSYSQISPIHLNEFKLLEKPHVTFSYFNKDGVKAVKQELKNAPNSDALLKVHAGVMSFGHTVEEDGSQFDITTNYIITKLKNGNFEALNALNSRYAFSEVSQPLKQAILADKDAADLLIKLRKATPDAWPIRLTANDAIQHINKFNFAASGTIEDLDSLIKFIRLLPLGESLKALDHIMPTLLASEQVQIKDRRELIELISTGNYNNKNELSMGVRLLSKLAQGQNTGGQNIDKKPILVAMRDKIKGDIAKLKQQNPTANTKFLLNNNKYLLKKLIDYAKEFGIKLSTSDLKVPTAQKEQKNHTQTSDTKKSGGFFNSLFSRKRTSDVRATETQIAKDAAKTMKKIKKEANNLSKSFVSKYSDRTYGYSSLNNQAMLVDKFQRHIVDKYFTGAQASSIDSLQKFVFSFKDKTVRIGIRQEGSELKAYIASETKKHKVSPAGAGRDNIQRKGPKHRQSEAGHSIPI